MTYVRGHGKDGSTKPDTSETFWEDSWWVGAEEFDMLLATSSFLIELLTISPYGFYSNKEGDWKKTEVLAWLASSEEEPGREPTSSFLLWATPQVSFLYNLLPSLEPLYLLSRILSTFVSKHPLVGSQVTAFLPSSTPNSQSWDLESLTLSKVNFLSGK